MPKTKAGGTVGPHRWQLSVIIGGDHSIAIGTAAGMSAHFTRTGLVWIDAHGDFNTEDSTISGNIHGMSLATALGRGTTRLVDAMGVKSRISEENCVVIGCRDLDPLEKVLLKESKVTVFTMRDIDELGMHTVMKHALQIACNGTDALYVSFDLDSIDPVDAPGVGTPVKGGITYREAHLAMEMAAETGSLKLFEIVELNPILDRQNETGRVAIALICSALGKSIY